MTRRSPLVVLLLLLASGCSYEDHAAQVIKGQEFKWPNWQCIRAGMSDADVARLLGTPFSKDTKGDVTRWRFWAVYQRGSTDRVLGIIPLEFKDTPYQAECLVTFRSGRVESVTGSPAVECQDRGEQHAQRPAG